MLDFSKQDRNNDILVDLAAKPMTEAQAQQAAQAQAAHDPADPIDEDGLPGHESALEPKPEWQPRYPGSGRLQGNYSANEVHFVNVTAAWGF